MSARGGFLLLALAFCGGLFTGLKMTRRPVPVAELPARERPERDVSPAGESHTVVLPAVEAGTPEPPPVQVPEEEGAQISTTTATAAGVTVHVGTLAQVDAAGALELRPVVWAEEGGRRVPVTVQHTAAPLRLEASRLRRWSGGLVVLQDDRGAHLGALLTRDVGQMRLMLGAAQGIAWAGAGWTW